MSYQIFGPNLHSAPIILVNHALTGNSNVVDFLETHPNVSFVKYPFLKFHPNYETAKNQIKMGGNIVAFEV